MRSNFDLIPFVQATAPPVKITGNIERQHNQLAIEYKIQGQSPVEDNSLKSILIPKITNTPTRQFDLWCHTCCEFFLGLFDSTQYWEFNLSPTGHWNVYRFLDYRQNLLEETAFDTLPFNVLQQNDCLQLNLVVDLNPIISPDQSLAVGITTVIEDHDNQLSYWALTHPVKEADFHHRDSYRITLEVD